MISAVGGAGRPAGIPTSLRVMSRMPPLLRLFSRFMAIGIRNEHVSLHRPVAAAASPSAGLPPEQGQRVQPEFEPAGRPGTEHLR